MSGYIRSSPRMWRDEHYAGRWTPTNPAPEYWAALDVAWFVDQGERPSGRDVGVKVWGWSKSRADRFIREQIQQQMDWEPRMERKAAIARMLGQSWGNPGIVPDGEPSAPWDTAPTTNADKTDHDGADMGQPWANPGPPVGRLMRAPSSKPDHQPHNPDADHETDPASHEPGAADAQPAPVSARDPRADRPAPSHHQAGAPGGHGAGLPSDPGAGDGDRPAESATAEPRPQRVSFQPWVPETPACRPHPRAEVEAMVLRIVEAVKGATVNPDKCVTVAPLVLSLWNKLRRPSPAAFEAEVRLVAEWAQQSPDPLAMRDICAIGWAEGTDRSRSVKTLCVHASWADRLDAAQAWAAKGKPPRGTAPPGRATPRGPLTLTEGLRALAEAEHTPPERVNVSTRPIVNGEWK